MKKPWDLNFKRAKGVIKTKYTTNAAIAERDYKRECNSEDGLIAVVSRYHIWWCRTHHQPQAYCSIQKLRIKLGKIEDIVQEL